MGVRRETLAAALWGFAEATLFFIVPDVLLTFILVRTGPGRALRAALVAALAAAAGGAVMLLWSAHAPASAFWAVAGVPNISDAMMSDAGIALASEGFLEMLRGSFAGVPFKVYAVEAQAAGINPLAFLAATVPVRLLRFASALTVVGLAQAGLCRMGASANLRLMILAVAWTAFYVWFFVMTPE